MFMVSLAFLKTIIGLIWNSYLLNIINTFGGWIRLFKNSVSLNKLLKTIVKGCMRTSLEMRAWYCILNEIGKTENLSILLTIFSGTDQPPLFIPYTWKTSQSLSSGDNGKVSCCHEKFTQTKRLIPTTLFIFIHPKCLLNPAKYISTIQFNLKRVNKPSTLKYFNVRISEIVYVCKMSKENRLHNLAKRDHFRLVVKSFNAKYVIKLH